MSLKSNCIVAFILLNCYVSPLSTRLNIERGDRDIFDNPNCDSPTKTGCKCKNLNAESVDGTNCKRCRCSSTYATFLSSNDKNDSRCVKNRLLLFIPGKHIDIIHQNIIFGIWLSDWKTFSHTSDKSGDPLYATKTLDQIQFIDERVVFSKPCNISLRDNYELQMLMYAHL